MPDLVLDSSALTPDLRVCFKPLDNVQGGGCHLEVYTVPDASKPTPVVLMMHGGGWTMGGPTSIPYAQVRWLREHGIAAASVEYRMVPHVKMKDMREDCLDAFRFAQSGLNVALAAANLSTVDPTRIGAWGASAGGTLVLFLGADVGDLVASDNTIPPLRAIIPTYPLADFHRFEPGGEHAEDKFDEVCAADPDFKAKYDALLADKCQVSAAWTTEEQAPTPELARRWEFSHQALHNGTLVPLLFDSMPLSPAASPLGALSARMPPTFVVVAEADQLIPPSQSYAVVEKLKSLGVDAAAGAGKDLPHGLAEMLPHQPAWPAGNKWWEDAIEPSLVFMSKYLSN